MSKWYPLQFNPILKEKVWGGSRLNTLLNKTDKKLPYGESWEIADLPDDQSIISNGNFRGKKLGDLLSAFAKAILGTSVIDRFGEHFPLLIKFIDAADDLSVQLHPDDEIAKERHNCFGKTEMWYIIYADPGAQLTIGFNQTMDAHTFDVAIKENRVSDYLKYVNVKAGDAFFINAGLIHAIGKGIVLAEIQQTSDVTYRIYDYERPQSDGTLRDLHLEDAKAAINYTLGEQAKLSYDHSKSGVQPLKHSDYFKTDIVQLNTQKYSIDRNDSFTIVIVVEGTIELFFENESEVLVTGQTVLIPAACQSVQVKGESAKFLEVYL